MTDIIIAEKKVWTGLGMQPVPTAVIFNDPGCGAELQFRGVVRGEEEKRPLRALRYTAYEEMAAKCLQRLAEEIHAAHPQTRLWFYHRLGEVSAGEASVLVAVAAPHSAEAYAVSQALLARLKKEVPIWKEPLWLTCREESEKK